MRPILDHKLEFPDPRLALEDPNGLLAIGGDLSSERLLLAYQNGIFPWFSENEPILWWSPDPRAVLLPEAFHVSRSFKKFLAKHDYNVTINHEFLSVIVACSALHGETWITNDMIDAYYQLHKLGFAHSIEVWHDKQLIGGLYGIAQGAVFCGESMFSVQVNASKVALYAFCQHFRSHGGQLIDCQVLNDHTASLGALTISRDDYLTHLTALKAATIDEQCWMKQPLLLKDK